MLQISPDLPAQVALDALSTPAFATMTHGAERRLAAKLAPILIRHLTHAGSAGSSFFGCADKMGSRGGGLIVTWAGICDRGQLGTRPDVGRGVGVPQAFYSGRPRPERAQASESSSCSGWNSLDHAHRAKSRTRSRQQAGYRSCVLHRGRAVNQLGWPLPDILRALPQLEGSG